MGQILKDHYELVQVIQSGGFGTTWLAKDIMLDMTVAIKEYHNPDPASQKNFIKEAKKLAKFSHEPGIVNVREYMEDGGKAYLVMEYLEGEDLSTKIEREGPCAFEKAWQMIRLNTLSAANNQLTDASALVNSTGLEKMDLSNNRF